MATYVYRCARDGDLEVRLPLGAAGPAVPCAQCAGDAVRVWSAPRVSRTPRAVAAAMDAAGRSAEVPRVVTRAPAPPRKPAVPRGLPRW
jgi:hypothetical protein